MGKEAGSKRKLPWYVHGTTIEALGLGNRNNHVLEVQDVNGLRKKSIWEREGGGVERKKQS